MPLYCWNDHDNKKYFNSYFSKYENIWYHGDYIEKTVNGGYIIHGRSDATLNSGGVRIGTAEIYPVFTKTNNSFGNEEWLMEEWGIFWDIYGEREAEFCAVSADWNWDSDSDDSR